MDFWKKISIIFSSALILSGCSVLDRKNVAGIQVITDDTPSSLFLDGQYLDKTPYINKEIKPGEYTLKIQPDDPQLTPYETQVALRKNALTVVTWNAGNKSENSGGIIYEMEEIKSNQGELSFITIPDNSIIKFDQGEQQFSPLVIKDIEPGHHQFEISLPSYEKQQHTINVIKGYRINVTAKLAKAKPPAAETVAADTAIKDAQQLEKLKQLTEQNKIAAQDATATLSGLINNSSSSGQVVTITPTGFFQNEIEVLKVRQAASSSAAIVGYATVGKSYPYLGEKIAGWFKIKLDSKIGWISDQYAKLTNE